MSDRASIPGPGAALFRVWRRTVKNYDGNVMIEFAFIAPLFIVLILNILDFSRLIWARMEVDYSAQMGAQAAYKTCSTGTLQATTNCTTSIVRSPLRSSRLRSAPG